MRIYGLFVGIDVYPEEVGSLNFCSADATALHSFFVRHTSPENLKLLVHPPHAFGASRAAHILTALKHFYDPPRTFMAQDIFIFFFAGHGLNVNGKYYLLTSDLNDLNPSQIIGAATDPDLLQTCSLPITILQEFVDKITTGNQVLIIDACRDEYRSRSPFNSSIDTAAYKAFSELKERKIRSDNKFIERAIVSSCRSNQRSWEYAPGGHGWFTYHLLECLHQFEGTPTDIGSLLTKVNNRMEAHCLDFPPAANQRPHLLLDGLPIQLPLGMGKQPPPPSPPPVESRSQQSFYIAARGKQSMFQLRPSTMRGPYLRVESPEQPNRELFYRPKDKQLAIGVPNAGSGVVLIDQFGTTSAQFCDCLNDLVRLGVAENKEIVSRGNERIWHCESERGVLAADALGFWRTHSNSKNAPWYCAGSPWGFCYAQEEKRWKPLHGSELLPAILVTWHGADAYSQWAHDDTPEEPGLFLPSEDAWRSAARTETRGLAIAGLNFAEHWADRELPTMREVQQYWEKQPSAFMLARPLPVADFVESASSCGGVQFLGNVWEWCRDSRDQQKRVIKGGCCYSSREQCNIEYSQAVNASRLDPYVGFRCAFNEKET